MKLCIRESNSKLHGVKLIGLDNMNDYYDVSIKKYRLAEIEALASEKSDCK